MFLPKTSIFSLFLLLFIFFGGGCASAPSNNSTEQDLDLQKGILWKISKPGVSPSYVFGTIHSEDERVVNLPDEVNDVFTGSDTLAVEMILDEENTRTITQGMFFHNGNTLKKILQPETYQNVVKVMSLRGFQEKVVNIMKPWAVFTVLNMPEQQTGLFLDAVLYQAAEKHDKNIIGLETVEEQLAVLDELSLDIQVNLLESSLNSKEDFSQILEETISIYLAHDLNAILALNDRYSKLLDKNIADMFNKRLIVDRNVRMVKRMKGLLEKGNAFIAVGALHLPGKLGILKLLQGMGYSVQAVY